MNWGDLGIREYSGMCVHLSFSHISNSVVLFYASFYHYTVNILKRLNACFSHITFLRFGKFGKPLSDVSPLLLSVSVSKLVY